MDVDTNVSDNTSMVQYEIDQLRDRLMDMQWKLDEVVAHNTYISSRMETLQMSLSSVCGTFLGVFGYEDFRRLVLNSPFYPDVTSGSILYYVGELFRLRELTGIYVNTIFITDWVVCLYDEIEIDDTLFDMIKSTYKIFNEYNHRDRCNDAVTSILDENLDAKLIYEHIEEDCMSYILSSVSIDTVIPVVSYSLEEDSTATFEKIFRIINSGVITNTDQYSDAYLLVYNILINKSHLLHQQFMKNATLIKRLRERSPRIDNYLKLLNQE